MTDFFEDKSEQVIEYRFKDPQRAYDICCEILEHGAETNDWYEISYAHLYMGDTLFSMGRLAESIEHMLIGEKVQKEYGYDDLLMKNYNITAIIYMTQGDDFLALDYFYYAMELAEQYEVQANPTLILFKDGQAKDRKTGALKQAEVNSWIEGLL